ncbi:MAG: glycosyltransferase family 2 protein [Selenomonadaceae bacterium]|nr:glycosyltransferase family 2 protein [Selenomonadaceae bacterium]
MLKEIPAISVVIPMYNAEKYIANCLNSLRVQTFQDFEVVVVDDCSTDNSVKVVESFREKFGGRLYLEKTKKNSGNGTLPRNIGLKFSRGEYIFFMDNDDAVTATALEELYNLAKNFNADVVHCEKYFNVPEDFLGTSAQIKQLKPYNYLTREKIFIEEPLIWDNNFEERVKFFAQRKLIWNIWVQLIRRDFLIKNSLKFVGAIADDMIFTTCELCCAEKYIIVPNVIYFYRQRQDSLIHKDFKIDKHLNVWIGMLKSGFDYLDNLLNDNEFFSQRPDLKYVLFGTFAQEMLNYLNGVYAQFPAYALDELLRKELGDSALTTFIFSVMNVQRLQIRQIQYQFNRFVEQSNQRIAQLENELKKRL